MDSVLIVNGASDVFTGTHEICMQDKQRFDESRLSLTL
jgi:hypothetical protein